MVLRTIMLGNTLRRRAHLAKAEPLYLDAIAILEQSPRTDPSHMNRIATANLELGALYGMQGKPEMALGMFTRARELYRQVRGEGSRKDRLVHTCADVVSISTVELNSLRDLRDLFRCFSRVILTAHIECAVLMAATEAAHMADLLFLEMLFELFLNRWLCTGHQTGAPVAHVCLHAFILGFQEIVESALISCEI